MAYPNLRDLARTIYGTLTPQILTRPDKAQIVERLFGGAEKRLRALEARTAGVGIVVEDWADLAAITPTANGQGGTVVGPDAGSHTDPVVGGTVDNVGIYTFHAGDGWERIGDYPTLSAADVGLGDVDNTADIDKPISEATQDALDLKADAASLATVATTGNSDNLIQGTTKLLMTAAERTKLAGVASGAQVNTVASVAGKTGAVALVKADVGLGSVDNTADAAKPVSTAQAAAIVSAPLFRARPGANPDAFCGNVLGGAAAPPPSGTSDVSDLDDLGDVAILQGAGFVTTRDKFPVSGAEAYWVQPVLQRRTNPTDPAGDVVRAQVNWLDKNGALISAAVGWPIPGTTPLTTAMGKQTPRFRFGAVGLQPPVGATDATVSIQAFGPNTSAGGTTHIAVIAVGPVDPFVSALETVAIATLTADPPVAEHGDSVTPELEWTITGPGTVAEQRINGVDIGSTTDRDWTAGSAITADTTYTLAVDDQQGNTVTRSVTVDFQHRVFWGASASATLNSAAIIALSGSALAASRVRDVTIDATGGKYVYFAYPASFGDPASYRLYGFEVDPVMTTVSVTTGAGFTGNYLVVRSPLPLTDDAVLLEVA
jgi:hypothetical protein